MNVQVAKLSLLNGTRRTTYPEMGEVAAKRGTLYVLMEVSAPSEEWDDISRRLVDSAIETFVIHKGPDTASLKEVVSTINQMVLETNAERTKTDAIWAGVNVVFMREGEMYLLQAGPALTYIARGSSVTRFPKSIDDTVFASLGVEKIVEPRLAKFALQVDDVVAMTGSFLPAHVSESALSEVMRRGTVEKVTNGLAELAQTELSSLVVQYEPTSVMVDPKVFVNPATTKQPTIPPKAAPFVPSTPFVMPRPTPSSDKAAEPSIAKTTTPLNDPTPPPVAKKSSPISDSTPPPVAKTTTPLRDASPPQETTPTPPRKSVVLPSVPEAKKTAPFVPPYEPESPPPRSNARQYVVEPKDEERANTFSTIPPQDDSSSKSSKRPKATPPKSPFGEDDVISGVARTIDPDEPKAAKSSRRKNDVPRAAPYANPMPPFSTTPITGSAATLDAPAAPTMPPILRQIGAGLLSVLSWLLAGLAQLIAWIEKVVAPRVASSGGVLDRAADGFWWMVDEAGMAGRRIMNQMLPGDRPDPARAPRQDEAGRGDGAAFFRTLVILIPLLFGAIAVGVWFFGDDASAPAFSTNRTENATYGTLIAEAQELINQASNVDEQTAQELITRALPLLTQAEPLAQNEGEVATIGALRSQAESLMSRADSVTSVALHPIVTFAAPISATELVYGNNALYMINGTNGSLYRLLPDQPATNGLEGILPLLNAQERLAAGVIVGTPSQMTWIPAGGGRVGDGLLTLTQEGQMFDFDVTSAILKQVTFAPVTGQIVASEGYGGNLYHLDTANRQIWKYVPDGGGEYPAAPVAWLTAQGQEQIGTPLDLAIDGYIFLLDQSGEVRRFQVGEVKSGFALDAVTPPLTEPVAMVKVPPEATDLFVADAQRVVRFDQNGKFVAEYRPTPGSTWGRIRDIAVNNDSTLLYVLSDTGVYWVEIAR